MNIAYTSLQSSALPTELPKDAYMCLEVSLDHCDHLHELRTTESSALNMIA